MGEVLTPNMPRPVVHYAQAVVHDGWAYISGLLSIDPAAGCGLDRVVKATDYITFFTFRDRINMVYPRDAGKHKPTHRIVPVKELILDFKSNRCTSFFSQNKAIFKV